MLLCSRQCIPVLLAVLCCCSCSTPEERADAAFGELVAVVQQLRVELSAISDAEAAQQVLPELEKESETLRDTLSRIDELACDENMTPEARRRVGEKYHEPLRTVTNAALAEVQRLARHALYHSEGLHRLARREYAHYSTKGIHPWARAVLDGREYRPRQVKN